MDSKNPGKLSSLATSQILVALSSFISFMLLTVTTFSTPFTPSLYFLRSSQGKGVRFGLWGWCLEGEDFCTDPQLGYTWEPEIPSSATKALVLFPASSAMLFLFMISNVFVLRAGPTRVHSYINRALAVLSLASSAFAFVFMVAIFDIAKHRFEKKGLEATLGPLPALSLVASLLLVLTVFLTFRLRPQEGGFGFGSSKAVSFPGGDSSDPEARLTPTKPRRQSRRFSRKF
ncbi:hypothetical protein CC2G_007627 [Coprinopsis cinerea AmutBmut pab1-1]|nr:hypothetical protein CC2G_007627 [Coprinopsis cinerea AmutBmut pab1-1]